MSHFQKIKYEIVSLKPYKIIRGCSGCGCKSQFCCTEKFRVNANGRRIDVWLVYQCEICGHTFNLPVYERRKQGEIPEKEYEAFLKNEKELEIYDPYDCEIRPDRLLAELFSISRSSIRRMEKCGKITISENRLERKVTISILKDF